MTLHRALQRDERGFSAVELLLFTIPLCVLSMALCSRLAATSRAKTRAQWQASLAAQKGATRLCGGNPALNAPWQSSQAAQKVNAIHGAASPVLDAAAAKNGALKVQTSTGDVARVLSHISKVGTIVSDTGMSMKELSTAIQGSAPFPTEILQQPQLTDTSWSIQTVQQPVDNFYFRGTSDRLLPGAAKSVTAGAAFICREPEESASSLDDIHTQLLVFAFDEASRFFQ